MATNNLLFISDANDFPSDEEHEKGLIKTNVLYRVNCTSDPPELVIRDDMSGRILSANLMDNSQVCFIYPSLERGGGDAVFANGYLSGCILHRLVAVIITGLVVREPVSANCKVN